jgi:hypothetical protein
VSVTEAGPILKRPQRSAGPKVPLAERVARLRALQAIPKHRLTAAEYEELERLEIRHCRMLGSLAPRIERLRAELAVLEELAR